MNIESCGRVVRAPASNSGHWLCEGFSSAWLSYVHSAKCFYSIEKEATSTSFDIPPN
jgi:hypothetical protein